MSHIKPFKFAILPLFVFGALALWPSQADAQRRRPPARTPVVRSVVVLGGIGYPRYPIYSPYYDPFLQYGSPWGPYGYPYGYGYGYGYRDDLTSSLRLQVTPREAEVLVDGYSAGTVDDFDGVFQRLRLRPGSHEVTIYLEGYRTIRQRLYLSPGADQKVKYAMEQLGPGVASEPPPPPAPVEVQGPETRGPGPDVFGRTAPRRPLPPDSRPDPRDVPQDVPQDRAPSARFGTLAIRVQPGDADILVDGERWSAPADQERVTIRLAEGRHRVEVRKAGFAQYGEDVLIRSGNTLSLNVSLLRGDDNGR